MFWQDDLWFHILCQCETKSRSFIFNGVSDWVKIPAHSTGIFNKIRFRLDERQTTQGAKHTRGKWVSRRPHSVRKRRVVAPPMAVIANRKSTSPIMKIYECPNGQAPQMQDSPWNSAPSSIRNLAVGYNACNCLIRNCRMCMKLFISSLRYFSFVIKLFEIR